MASSRVAKVLNGLPAALFTAINPTSFSPVIPTTVRTECKGWLSISFLNQFNKYRPGLKVGIILNHYVFLPVLDETNPGRLIVLEQLKS